MEILLILPGFILAILIMVIYEIKLRKIQNKEQNMSLNNVHFYVARDKDGILGLWLGKPHRVKNYWITKGNNMLIAADIKLNLYGLNIEDYKDLKWEDKPKEVFLNLED